MGSRNYKLAFLFFMIMGLFTYCSEPSTYESIKSYIDDIPVIDTHSHQGMPWKDNYNLFDMGMYLHTDLISAGMPEYTEEMENRSDPEEYWAHTAPYLRFCRTTSYYTQFIYNYKKLYGFEGYELTKQDFLNYSDQMDQHFKDYKNWLDSSYKKLNIETIFSDRVWQPFNTDFDTTFFRYVFRIDELILDIKEVARNNKVVNQHALKLLDKEDVKIPDLDSYLGFVDEVLTSVTNQGAVAFKVGLAYHRDIQFAEVKYEDARACFQKNSWNESDIKSLQDFIVFHIIKRAGDLNIPVQIHTGYLHGNRNWLERGYPLKVLPLVRKYPEVRFILFHGGYPWIGENLIMAKNYPNVYLDIVWLPQLSRTAAIRGLHEILDTVPYNKITWGSDVGFIDDVAGSLELGREVVAIVLSERVERDWITEDIAHDIAKRIFRENAIEIFDLID